MTGLTGDEFRVLHEELVKAFEDYDQLAILARVRLGLSLSSIASANGTSHVVFKLMIWAEEQGKIRDLIFGAMLERPNRLSLREYCTVLIQNLGNREPPIWYSAPDPYLSCFVLGNQPFVNQREVRKEFRKLQAQISTGLLIVNGSQNSGKSYSRELMFYLQRLLGSFRVAWIDLKLEGSSRIKPEELARDLSTQIGNREEPTKRRELSDNRWVKQLAIDVIGAIHRNLQQTKTKSWWIVLDGFRRMEEPRETHELIHWLMRYATGLPQLCVVLLDYDKRLLPPDLQGRVSVVVLPSITRQEIADFFADVFSHKGQARDPGQIAEDVEGILGKIHVPPEHPDYLCILNDLILSKMRELFPGEF